MQQCEKFAYIATRLTADHSKMQRGATRRHVAVSNTTTNMIRKSQIFPAIDSLPASGLTPRTSRLDRFFCASPFYVCFSFFIILFCLVPCGRLSWLLVSFWAHINIVHRIVLGCQSCASHAHVGDLPGNNAARNALCSSPAHPVHLAAVSSYADQCDVSVSPATGQSVLQSRAQQTSSALWKNLWRICWPTVTHI